MITIFLEDLSWKTWRWDCGIKDPHSQWWCCSWFPPTTAQSLWTWQTIGVLPRFWEKLNWLLMTLFLNAQEVVIKTTCWPISFIKTFFGLPDYRKLNYVLSVTEGKWNLHVPASLLGDGQILNDRVCVAKFAMSKFELSFGRLKSWFLWNANNLLLVLSKNIMLEHF